MKFIHLSDLHLGISLNQYNLIDDQKYILNQIIDIIKQKSPDGIIIAGDIYDKSIPTIEATKLFSSFLTELANLKIPVFIISGNHDGADRLAFGCDIIKMSGIYISPVYNGKIEPITMTDEFGSLNVYMLPFIKPINVRQAFPETQINSYNDAMKEALAHIPVDDSQRNILITHQYISGAKTSDSELSLVIGTTEQISASLFTQFDYVALGHLHRPQNVTPLIRYCGTPLKYSFSETNDKKTVTLVTLREKNNINIEEIPLSPLHEMHELKNSLENILNSKNYTDVKNDDYVRVKLTDEDEIPDALQQLKTRFKNILHLEFDNSRTNAEIDLSFGDTDTEAKDPLELFAVFYQKMNNRELNEEQRDFMKELFEECNFEGIEQEEK